MQMHYRVTTALRNSWYKVKVVQHSLLWRCTLFHLQSRSHPLPDLRVRRKEKGRKVHTHQYFIKVKLKKKSKLVF